ncbi:hypothetical protein E2542_SST19436 [Spatholobus suberectus]|nr:hypothetical protein E2542_SST19436 [Spatholobus suberectus]
MTIASGVKEDDGLVNVVSSAVVVPVIPATVTMASIGAVNVNPVVPEDERSNHEFRRPLLPLQLVQPKSSCGLGLPSPDSVTSDNSLAFTNSFSRIVYCQDQVQVAH